MSNDPPELKLEDWIPMEWSKGPPLPRWLGIYWPWYEKEEVPGVYTCPYCGATFSTQEELNQHILTEHPEAPPVTYTCPVCGAVFSTEAELNYHIQTEHPTAPPVADIRVENLVISLTEVNVGQKVTISVTATNYGSASGSKTINCSVDGSNSTQIVTLNQGESKVISFETTPSQAKTYQVGVDGLTGSFIALPLARFEYVDIRRVSPRIAGATGANEVDIRNIGAISGVCNVRATIGGARTIVVIPKSATLNPGETATFQIEWGEEVTRESANIYSEAGVINYLVGEAKCSVDIPPQIVSGSEYWATLTVYLKDSRYIQYNVNVYLRPLPPIELKYSRESLPAVSAKIQNPLFTEYWPLALTDVPLTGDGYYTIRGVHKWLYPPPNYQLTLVETPAIASSRGQMAYSDPIPLPPGIYEVVVELRFSIYASATATTMSAYGSWQIPYPKELCKILPVTVGQVEII